MPFDPSLYQQEADRLAQRGKRGGGGTDYIWVTINKPANVGGTSRTPLRVIPRPVFDAEGNPTSAYHSKFWVGVDRHVVQVAGQTVTASCPDNPDDPNAPAVCPVCALRRELYSAKNKAWAEIARDLRVEHRLYALVLSLDDWNAHWKQDAQTQAWTGQPMVWGYSKKTHNDIIQLILTKQTSIESMDHGRDLVVAVNRIGGNKMDIRYSVADRDASALPAEWRSLAWPNADQGVTVPDLEKMRVDPDLQVLGKIAAQMDPRGSRRGPVQGGGYEPQGGGYGGPPTGGQGQAPAGYGGPPSAPGGPRRPRRPPSAVSFATADPAVSRRD